MCRIFQTETNRLEDLTPDRASLLKLGTGTRGSNRSPASSPDQALDCWCHGVTHLLSALGREAALSLMARTVVDLIDSGTPATPLAPA